MSLGEGNASVVVVDDQDLVRAGLASLLDGADGIRVVGQASNGEEGMRLIRDMHPDVALIDIRMPVLNGLETIEQVRRDPACADGFLLKNAEPDDLIRSVHQVARGDAVISPAVTRTLIDDYLRGPSRHPARTPPHLTDRERDILGGICRVGLVIAAGECGLLDES